MQGPRRKLHKPSTLALHRRTIVARRAPVCGAWRLLVPHRSRRLIGMRELTRVENSGGITASLQGRYASALYELASDKKCVTAVETDLDTLGDALVQAPDLAALIRSPRVGRGEAAKALVDAPREYSIVPFF